MKELRLYFDSLKGDMVWNDSKGVIPNCMPNDKGITFGNYGFMVTRSSGVEKFNKCVQEFKITLTNNRSNSMEHNL